MISLSADRVKGCNIASLVAAVWSAVVRKGCRAASLFASESAFLRKKVIIISNFSLLITNLFLLACSGSSDGSEESQKPLDEPSVLNIYVYAPGQAVPTRGNEGLVDAETAENAINTLQIWVFTHEDTPKLVTYFKTNSFTDTSENGVSRFELPIPTWYTSDTKNVDVYVLGNVTPLNCGLSFDETSTVSDLEGAMLQSDYFGLSGSLATEVPFEGLPMSGVLRNQVVSGSYPVLTLGPSHDNMAKVKLARVVSRIRFVFSSSSSDFDGLQITKVTLDALKIPNKEYIFLLEPEEESTFGNPYDYKDNDLHIVTGEPKGDYYNAAESASLFSIEKTASCADPAYYAWDRFVNDAPEEMTQQQKAQGYETLISEAVATTYEGEEAPRLTERRLYLRESDQLLSGTIFYKIKDKGDEEYGTEKSVTFSMVAPVEGDPEPHYFFSRNHTWTVYAYLSWAKMNIVAVRINTWEPSDPADYTLYNW